MRKGVDTMNRLLYEFNEQIGISTFDLQNEWDTGKYKKANDCPSYEQLSVIIKSYNVINQYYGDDLLCIQDIIADLD